MAIYLKLNDNEEAAVVAIGLVGIVHDEKNSEVWRIAASTVANRLDALRQNWAYWNDATR